MTPVAIGDVQRTQGTLKTVYNAKNRYRQLLLCLHIAYENRAHSPGKMCIGWSRNEFTKQSGSHVFDYDEWCIVDLKTKSETKSPKSQNTFLVYDSKGKNILELDCSTKKFQLIRSHETGLCGVSGMCYVKNRDMLVLTSQEDHMIKAVNIDNGNTMWCLHFRIEGKICQPWDVKYDAHTSGGSRIFNRGVRQLPKLLLFFEFLLKTA